MEIEFVSIAFWKKIMSSEVGYWMSLIFQINYFHSVKKAQQNHFMSTNLRGLTEFNLVFKNQNKWVKNQSTDVIGKTFSEYGRVILRVTKELHTLPKNR